MSLWGHFNKVLAAVSAAWFGQNNEGDLGVTFPSWRRYKKGKAVGGDGVEPWGDPAPVLGG